jgi:hypothetical protein
MKALLGEKWEALNKFGGSKKPSSIHDEVIIHFVLRNIHKKHSSTMLSAEVKCS